MANTSKKSEARSANPEDDSTTELIYEKGAMREYPLSVLSDEVAHKRLSTSTHEKLLIAALVVVALIFRTRNLQSPNEVVFDEVHFGGFASKYIKGNFFMDVHPPLAKLIYAGIALLGGFNGNFTFEKIGTVYPANVPYVLMRQFSAFAGVGTVVLMYLTLRATGCKPIVSALTSLLLVFESANATIDRFILLDSPLIFFIAAAAYSYLKLEDCKPFTLRWYKALLATGICLGCATSSKWVGLFTVVWVGICTVIRLWFVIGDLTVPVRSILSQAFLRFFVILGSCALVYLASFYIHLQVLNHEGDGAAFLSSSFRSSFDDASIPKSIYADVGASSIITLKHLSNPEGYLHSHNHLYEAGSKQQQVSLYPYQDDNNRWTVELYNMSSEPLEFIPIMDHTKIRLKHLATSRRLHSHDIRPSVSEIDWQNEASCYGFEGFDGDPNDDFVVEIVKDKSVKGVAQERVRAIDTVFRLHHAMTGCYLFSHETRLPKWGFEQNEVTCAKQGIESLSLWYIEQNENMYLDQLNAEKVSYKPLTFWQKLVELNEAMWKVNSGLTQPHVYESKPHSWPFLSRGISYWKSDNFQVYLLGNPVVWWIASFVFLPFGFYLALQLVRWQWGSSIADNSVLFNFNYHTFEFVLGWFVHYFPSFLMGRQMFLHHYLPALYFAILAIGQTLEYVNSYLLKGKKYVTYAVFTAILGLTVYSYLQREPLISANIWTQSKCAASKIMSGWDYDCDIYPNEAPPPPVISYSEQPKPSINFDEAINIDNVQAPIRDEL
ncbi:DEKNAAC100156 [Brettanomyces naardenensis]|uniref:Dolichyl-phosphate-mannose--protein mannosyltransferase n=1 Tax=Brettanomyces naardenensis TaxID=13370 RepID=A0A448YF80_BRENA|nr:DEKNAAC100156 [Brettanomyces naardenensis]